MSFVILCIVNRDCDLFWICISPERVMISKENVDVKKVKHFTVNTKTLFN